MSSDIYEIECVVIGAGVVGLACAKALAERGRDVIVLEAEATIGTGISSRNSEVIHAGIYYPTGSLRHRLCVEGRRRLYPYVAEHGVGHRKCGKLVVAVTAAEEAKIESIYQRSLENEVENVALISGAEARALEPNLACVSAMVSPETGIVDSHGLMLALLGDFERAGGSVVFSTRVRDIAVQRGGGFRLALADAEESLLQTRMIVNAAGLRAQMTAAAIDALPRAAIPPLVLAKGNYFGCSGKPAFSRLIYPAPVEGGLGVHLTVDLAGRTRFGPDVEWLDHADPNRVDYNVDLKRAESFYAAIRRYWPTLADDALTPDYSGCRPKLSGPGLSAADFRIDGPAFHGLSGLVNLFGIESPGLTCSLAIADEVADLAEDKALPLAANF